MVDKNARATFDPARLVCGEESWEEYQGVFTVPATHLDRDIDIKRGWVMKRTPWKRDRRKAIRAAWELRNPAESGASEVTWIKRTVHAEASYLEVL